MPEKTRAYIVGTCDTKGDELRYLKRLIQATGVPAVLVDVGTRGEDSSGGSTALAADIRSDEVAAYHPDGSAAVFCGERSAAITAMGIALAHFLPSRADLGGVIGLGGSGGSALIAPAMQILPIGVPKVLVSTLASGDVAAYVGPSDLHMVHAVTDIAGLNRISSVVLGNAAHALAGMIRHPVDTPATAKPALALSMFGVTTACVRQVTEALDADYDCIVFHATGTGGRAMEKLVDDQLVVGLVDITTSEIADLLAGGLFSAGEDRLGAAARTHLPYIGSCGALDMVNFRGMATVPAQYRNRLLHAHNPHITLMRTNAEENARIGAWIGMKLNACHGPVRFLIPEKGVSALDAPGQPFHDPVADAVLFTALEATVRPTADRRLDRIPHHINDPAFAAALVGACRELMG